MSLAYEIEIDDDVYSTFVMCLRDDLKANVYSHFTWLLDDYEFKPEGQNTDFLTERLVQLVLNDSSLQSCFERVFAENQLRKVIPNYKKFAEHPMIKDLFVIDQDQFKWISFDDEKFQRKTLKELFMLRKFCQESHDIRYESQFSNEIMDSKRVRSNNGAKNPELLTTIFFKQEEEK